MGARSRLRTQHVAAALALLMAAGLGTHWFLRSRSAYGSTFSDGLRHWTTRDGEEVRHSVWAEPEPLALTEEAHDPTLSPDGRWLVFVLGERGLNADLYVSEMHEGVPGPPERLSISTADDELAPAFVDGWLVFASDRPGGAGGLDLWRAPFWDGIPGEAEPMEPGLNSPADETDAAGDGQVLYLASNRERGMRRDLALYRAVHELDHWSLERLEELDSPFDEREPAPGPDGRALTFASDRPGGRGGFDLWRTTRPTDTTPLWSPPALLEELSTAEDERGPWTRDEGFALLFEGRDAEGSARLLLARSRELVLLPPPVMTLAEWLLLAALLLTAVLALLARRWRPLDILYKCLLVSILLHLLLLLYLRTVEPRTDPREFGRDEGPSYRVRLAPAETGIAEAGGPRRRHTDRPSEPGREHFATLANPTPSATVATLSIPERPETRPPAREALSTPAPTTGVAGPRMEDREPALQRLDRAAPALALTALAPAAARPVVATSSVERSGPTTGVLPDAHPHEKALEPVTAMEALGQVAVPGRSALQASPTEPGTVAIGAPSEELAPLTAPSAPLSLPASRREAPRERVLASAPQRSRSDPVATDPDGPAEPRPSVPVLRAPERIEPNAPGLAQRSPVPIPGAIAQDVRRPQEVLVEAASGTAPFDALTGLGSARTPARTASPVATPERIAEASSRLPGEIRPAEVALGAPAAELPTGPGMTRLDTPAPAATALDLRLPTEEPRPSASALGASPHPYDALDGLSDESLRRRPAAPVVALERETSDENLEVLRPPPISIEMPEAEPPSAPAPRRSGAPAEVAAAIDLRPANEPLEELPAAQPAPSLDSLLELDLERDRSSRSIPEGPQRRLALERPPAIPDAEPLRTDWSVPTHEGPTPPAPDRAAPRLERTAYQNRFGEQKLRALEEFGGTRETEEAVARGLDYLAAIQARDGAWGSRRDAHEKYGDVRPGKTGLALLAFLGAGHLPGRPGPHAPTVDRAVRWLLEQQHASGHFGTGGPYSHGIATYALAEALALTRDEGLRAPVQRGVARIVATQTRSRDRRADGGWGYFFSDDHVWNRDRWPRTSVTAWQVMALESARLSGLVVPDETFAAARDFLSGAWDERAGAFRYSHDPARLSSGYPILPASTPAALFALSLLGIPADASELAEARRFVLQRKPDGYRFTGSDDFVLRARGNLYFWYYGTLAMFRVGGRPWETWNAAMKATLLPAQRDDGSWEPLDVYGEYAGDEDDESAYTTALCVLSLEVYYRYFTPLLQVGVAPAEAPR